MKKHGVIALVTCLLLAACNNHENLHQYAYQEGEETTIFSLPLPGNNRAHKVQAGTRPHTGEGDTYQSSDLTPLLWNATDQLTVFAYEENGETVTVTKAANPFTLASGAGTAQATFKGVMPVETDDYFVVCAAGNNHTITSNAQGSTYKMTVTGLIVPSVQTAVIRQNESEAPTFEKDLMPLLGLGDKDGFEVVNAGCALRFRLYSTSVVKIKQVRILSTNGDALAGTASYDYNYDKGTKTLTLSHKTTVSAENNISLNMPEGGYTLPTTAPATQETGQYFYFVMPAPVSMPQGFVLYVTTADNKEYYKSYQGETWKLNIGFNQIYTLNPNGAIEFSTTGWTSAN